ncbi:MAG: hypothetical protein RBS57_00415 [Desulforhabdus sp.]|jgi:predicted nucleic acid-binding protein|nr:hypothetical protein [Desulforhabdus sp.]
MKVMFDTNVYISYIRSGLHSDTMERRGTVKFIAETVLMELWAGAKTGRAERFLQKSLKPYVTAGRVVKLKAKHHVAIGQFIAHLPKQYGTLIQKAGFLNDIHIAFMAVSIGTVLYTEDRDHFEIIRTGLPSVKVEFLQNK